MRAIGLRILLSIAIFFAGFFTHMHFASIGQLKTEVKAEKAAVKQTAQSAAKAQVASVKVEAKIASTATNVDQAKAAIHKRVSTQIARHVAAANHHATTESKPDAPVETSSCGRFYLDAGTARLLNDARAGAAVHSAGSGDAASDAAPALCFTDFVDADLDLTKLYLDLSERHNALVDAVEEFQHEQRQRLGIEDTDAVSK